MSARPGVGRARRARFETDSESDPEDSVDR